MREKKMLDIATKFIAELNKKHNARNYNYYLNTRGSKFFKVEQESHGQRSVHAFIEKSTGKVIKAATWKAPQKDKSGLAYRWDLSTPEGFAACVAAADPYGSYLYKDFTPPAPVVEPIASDGLGRIFI